MPPNFDASLLIPWPDIRPRPFILSYERKNPLVPTSFYNHDQEFQAHPHPIVIYLFQVVI